MKKRNTIEWLVFFGIFLIDDNGWGNRKTYSEEINVVEFCSRICQSTIRLSLNSIEKERRKTLDFIV